MDRSVSLPFAIPSASILIHVHLDLFQRGSLQLDFRYNTGQRWITNHLYNGERGGSVVECQTPEREVGGWIPTSAVLCP